MKLGAHISASGGLHNAPINAATLGLECFQFFSRPPQGGKVNPIAPEASKLFLDTCETNGFSTWYIHAPYIINLASKEERIRKNSIEILRNELIRANALKTRAVMFHPGSASGVGEEVGLKLVTESMKEILKDYKGETLFLIEISAGAGMVIGDAFEEVKTIMDGVAHEKVAVCFDTAHAFASGYDLRTKKTVEATMKQFDDTIGLENLILSHCNDSKVDLGERKDRHEHLGQGFIGLEGFKSIVASPTFKNVDLILETPHDDLLPQDLANLKKFRSSSLRGGTADEAIS